MTRDEYAQACGAALGDIEWTLRELVSRHEELNGLTQFDNDPQLQPPGMYLAQALGCLSVVGAALSQDRTLRTYAALDKVAKKLVPLAMKNLAKNRR